MDAGRLIARLTIGGLFVGHGTQKLFGWFGGPGPEGTAGMMEKLDLEPPQRNARAAGLSETVGGALLALGGLMPAAGALLSGTMFTAIRKVHFRNGLWNTERGYEYHLVLIAAIASLIESGPGRPSLDRAFGTELRGSKWALAAIGAGAAGSALVIESGRREAEQEAPAPEPREGTDVHRPERVELPEPIEV